MRYVTRFWLGVRAGSGCPNGVDHKGGVCTCTPKRPGN